MRSRCCSGNRGNRWRSRWPSQSTTASAHSPRPELSLTCSEDRQPYLARRSLELPQRDGGNLLPAQALALTQRAAPLCHRLKSTDLVLPALSVLLSRPFTFCRCYFSGPFPASRDRIFVLARTSCARPPRVAPEFAAGCRAVAIQPDVINDPLRALRLTADTGIPKQAPSAPLSCKREG